MYFVDVIRSFKFIYLAHVVFLLDSAALECLYGNKFQQTLCFVEIIHSWDIIPVVRVTVRPNLHHSPSRFSYNFMSQQVQGRNANQHVMTWITTPFLHSELGAGRRAVSRQRLLTGTSPSIGPSLCPHMLDITVHLWLTWPFNGIQASPMLTALRMHRYSILLNKLMWKYSTGYKNTLHYQNSLLHLWMK